MASLSFVHLSAGTTSTGQPDVSSRLRQRACSRIVLSEATLNPSCSSEPIASGSTGRAFPVATTLEDHHRKSQDGHSLKVEHTHLDLVLFGGDGLSQHLFQKVGGGSLEHKRSVSLREDCAIHLCLIRFPFGPSGTGSWCLQLGCTYTHFRVHVDVGMCTDPSDDTSR